MVSTANIGDASAISDQSDLFSTGILDSLTVVQLVFFAEKQFGIKLSGTAAATIQNFNNIQRMAEIIEQKAQTQP